MSLPINMLRQASGGVKHHKKVRSKNVLDRIEDCDKTGQYELDLSNLDLLEWPKETIVVPAIHILDAHGNRFTSIPTLTFRGLEVLNLSRCQLSSIADIGFVSLHHLHRLDLSRNNIKELPADIVKLFSLDTLLLDRNQLEAFPPAMHTMRNLRVLDASHNCIINIGSALDVLPSLDDLNLSHNPNLVTAALGTRTRRLMDKRNLMASKSERRVLIQRALAVQRAVLTREQQSIFREIYTGGASDVNELP